MRPSRPQPLIAAIAVACGLASCQPQVSSATKDSKNEQARQPVTGFADPTAVNAAVFRMREVIYFGGMTTDVSISGGKAVVTWTGMGGRDAQTAEIVLNAEQSALYRDVINIVVRDELWKQTDKKVEAKDGGERSFEFDVAGHKGNFTLINDSPRHLAPFLTKTSYLLSSLQEQARRQVRPSPPAETPDSATPRADEQPLQNDDE